MARVDQVTKIEGLTAFNLQEELDGEDWKHEDNVYEEESDGEDETDDETGDEEGEDQSEDEGPNAEACTKRQREDDNIVIDDPEDIAGIQTTNIIVGKRRRQAPKRYVDDNFTDLMTADIPQNEIDAALCDEIITEDEDSEHEDGGVSGDEYDQDFIDD